MSFQTFLAAFLNLLLHLDLHLKAVIEAYHFWTYAIIFAVIFCETGLVFVPFLPGDSLLFAAGAFAALGSLNIYVLFLTILVAAVIGDFVNYTIGKYIGPRIFKKEDSFFFNKKYLAHTENFYAQHGSKTIIAARFMPIIRTFAPFVAGIGKMNLSKFMVYNIAGALLWCSFFILGGYLFGNMTIIKEHFNWVIIGIILLSFIPILKGILQHWHRSRKQKKENQ